MPGDRAAHLSRVGMIAVERLHERIDRHRRRIVFVLADRGDQVLAPRRDLVIGKSRMPGHVGGQRQHRGKIVRQAGGSDRHLVAPGDHRQRRAAAVEIVGNRVRRSSHGAAIEHSRAERGGAVAIGRVRIGAGA